MREAAEPEAPSPGSAVDRAREFGVDVTLLEALLRGVHELREGLEASRSSGPVRS